MISTRTNFGKPLLLVALLSLVIAVVVTPATAYAGKGKCIGVNVVSATDDGKQKKKKKRRPKFAISKIVDLRFDVQVGGRIKGDEVVELRVLTPNGHLYETYKIPIAEQPVPIDGVQPIDVNNRAEVENVDLGSRRLAGYPRPIKVQPLKERKGRRTVSINFPVAGTTIVQNGLYGKWRLEAAVDGVDREICKRSTFVLRDK